MLSWQSAGEHSDLILQQSGTAGFAEARNIPIAAAGSVTITGLADGSYYFRAGTDGQWSRSVRVDVMHHDLGQALRYFFSGLLLFLILTVVILAGNRSTGVTS